MTKVRQTFEISLTKSIVRVLFMRFELPLTPNTPPPPQYFNGPCDQYVVEVTGTCSMERYWLSSLAIFL